MRGIPTHRAWLRSGVFALLIAGTPALAQTATTKEELTAAFVGKSARFPDGAISTYNADGSFVYMTRSPAQGKYVIQDGGIICVTFTNNSSRCDTILKDGNSFILVNRSGTRFPLSLF